MEKIDKRVPTTCQECGSTGSLVPSDRKGLLACAGCGTYHEYLVQTRSDYR